MYKVEDIKWLIEYIFEKNSLLTVHQATRYKHLERGIVNNLTKVKSKSFEELENIMSDTIIPNFEVCSDNYLDNWIIGFINGEISFTYATKTTKKIPIICLEHTDERVIKLIKSRLNIGPNISIKQRDNRKPTYTLIFCSKKDISNTIQFIDRINNLKGYKLLQYNEWKKKFNL